MSVYLLLRFEMHGWLGIKGPTQNQAKKCRIGEGTSPVSFGRRRAKCNEPCNEHTSHTQLTSFSVFCSIRVKNLIQILSSSLLATISNAKCAAESLGCFLLLALLPLCNLPTVPCKFRMVSSVAVLMVALPCPLPIHNTYTKAQVLQCNYFNLLFEGLNGTFNLSTVWFSPFP